ncbi:MAG: HD domain-containing protein [Bacteroides sp.]|nr:HD domain-containing protein [Bacteroides sp.]
MFLHHLRQNEAAEAERRFGHHDLTHFLDVARIGEIINLESGLGIDREWVYAAALLHDMGRHIQYEDGTPHELASAEIAVQILRECGFADSEADVIIDAIKSHRDASVAGEDTLRGVLYRADKACRLCFACDVEQECHRSEDKKNRKLRY